MMEFEYCKTVAQFLAVCWLLDNGVGAQYIRLEDDTTVMAVHNGGFCLRVRWEDGNARIMGDESLEF